MRKSLFSNGFGDMLTEKLLTIENFKYRSPKLDRAIEDLLDVFDEESPEIYPPFEMRIISLKATPLIERVELSMVKNLNGTNGKCKLAKQNKRNQSKHPSDDHLSQRPESKTLDLSLKHSRSQFFYLTDIIGVEINFFI